MGRAGCDPGLKGGLGVAYRMRMIVAMWLVVCSAWLTSLSVDAQNNSSLTLQVVVCPDGVEPINPLSECGGRVAASFPYEITAGQTREENLIETSGTSDGSSSVAIDLTGALPGYVTVLFPLGGSNRGAVGLDCSLNGLPLDTVTGIDAVGYPAYAIEAGEAGDLNCTLFARGFAGDTEYFGIVDDTPTDTNSDNSSVTADSAAESSDTEATTSGSSVSALPATGTGHAPVGLPIELAGFGLLLAVGAWVLRRRFVIR